MSYEVNTMRFGLQGLTQNVMNGAEHMSNRGPRPTLQVLLHMSAKSYEVGLREKTKNSVLKLLCFSTAWQTYARQKPGSEVIVVVHCHKEPELTTH